jgi:hypothetical protein
MCIKKSEYYCLDGIGLSYVTYFPLSVNSYFVFSKCNSMLAKVY